MGSRLQVGSVRRTALALIGMAAAAAATAGSASAPEPSPTPIVVARLVAEGSSLEPTGEAWIALHLDIRREGWHVYWKNPGDSGTPPRAEWRLPDGVEVSELDWPAPRRFVMGPLASYGYEGEVYLPARISLAAAAGPTVRLMARASWLACKVECIPESADLTLELPLRSTPASPSTEADAIRAALAAVPVPSPFGPARLVDQDERSLLLRAELGAALDANSDDFLFFPDVGGVIEPAADQPAVVSDGAVTLRLTKSPMLLEPVASLSGVLRVGPNGSIPLAALALVATADRGPTTPQGRLLPAIGLAFVGGLLLNLMPCVFPVLAIKVMGFASNTGATRAHSVLHGLVFALGVLVSFWALAGILLALRASGAEIGWGFQLQSPSFVLGLAFLFFAMALVFLGAVEFGTRMATVAGSLARPQGGLLGSFSSGALATAVATPCTAPFMGTALGYALASTPAAAFAVFTSLALGMGLPYVALAASPWLARALPRPGPWMETLRQLLAFPLLATVLWLLWVFAQQTGSGALVAALGGLLLAAFGLWIAGRLAGSATPRSRLMAWAPAFGAVALGFALALPSDDASAPIASRTGAVADDLVWVPYSPAGLEEERGRGRPVYVDFTASWCLTCQFNKHVVFGSAEVVRAFRRHGVILMRADWTHGDPEITRALLSFGRSGVPLNVLYGPDPSADPIVLSSVLTPSMVLRALEETL